MSGLRICLALSRCSPSAMGRSPLSMGLGFKEENEMPKLRTSKNSNTATKLRRAVSMLEPNLDLDTILALSDAEVAAVILHYAEHVDAQRHVRPEPNNEEQ